MTGLRTPREPMTNHGAARLRRAGDTRRQMVLLAVDLVLISLSLWFVLVLHPYVPMDQLDQYPLWSWLRWWVLLWAIWLPLASSLGLYNLRLAGDPDHAVILALAAWAVTSLLYAVTPVISAPLFVRRWIWFAFFGITGGALSLWRGAHALLWTSRQPWKLVFLGSSGAIEETAAAVDAVQGAEVVAVFHTAVGGASAPGGPVSDDPWQACARLIAAHAVDGLAVDHALSAEPDIQRLIARSAEQGTEVTSLSACSEAWLGRVRLDPALVRVWMASIAEHRIALRLHGAVRRLVDVLFVLFCIPLLIIAIPVIGLTAVLARKQPVLAHQLCTGLNGRPFRALVFRQAHHHFLQRLPLLWNLLVGDISLIGPRIIAADQATALAKLEPFLSLRHVIRPGLTGWAQVRAGPTGGQSLVAAELPYDLYYVIHQSLSLDLAIAYHRLRKAFQ